jgi:anti-sigma regulatory factor (Ser/Thr protein kinase)
VAGPPRVPPTSHPPPSFQAELTGELDQLGELRQRCAELLWASPDRVIGDVQLVVTELVSNVLRHTPHRAGQVAVWQEGADVHVSVSDLSSVPPRLVHGAPVGGRGIHIVDAVASAWGVVRDRQGKTVWADIGLGP